MNNSFNSNQFGFYEFLLNLCSNENLRNKNLPRLGKVFLTVFKNESEIDYPVIFKIVSKSQINNEDIDTILEIINEIENQVTDDPPLNLLRKMKRHFKLSYEQKLYFEDLQNNYLKELNKSKTELINVQENLTNVQESIGDATTIFEELNLEVRHIYAQFLTILGIFTAIVISVFGGLQLLSSIFQNMSNVPTWKLISIGSLLCIGILTILFLLTRWISMITKISFGISSKNSIIEIIKDNAAYVTGISIFIYFIVASVILSSADFKNQLLELMSMQYYLPSFIILASPLLLIIGVLIIKLIKVIYKKS